MVSFFFEEVKDEGSKLGKILELRDLKMRLVSMALIINSENQNQEVETN